MTHRGTGEMVDVDFLDGTADWIKRWFYLNHLKSLRTPGFVEERIHQLYPTIETISLGLDELTELGLLETDEYGGAMRLCCDWEALAQLLNRIEQQWSDPKIKAAMAQALSDAVPWPLELGKAEWHCSQPLTERLDWLTAEFTSGSDPANALSALADLKAPQLDELLEWALAGPPTSLVSRAISIIDANESEQQWARQLQRVICRLDPNDDAPAPHIWISAAKLLQSKSNETMATAVLGNRIQQPG